jgi:hypothetical protein
MLPSSFPISSPADSFLVIISSQHPLGINLLSYSPLCGIQMRPRRQEGLCYGVYTLKKQSYVVQLDYLFASLINPVVSYMDIFNYAPKALKADGQTDPKQGHLTLS